MSFTLIVEVALVKHLATVLHVHDHTVEHDERLSVALQRVQSCNVHGVARSQVASSRDGSDVTSQSLADEVVYAHIGRIAEVRGCHLSAGLSGSGVVGAERGGVQPSVNAVEVLSDGPLLQVVAVDLHRHGRNVAWDRQFVMTVAVGHGSVSVVAVGLNAHTGQGLSCGGIGHHAAHGNLVAVGRISGQGHRAIADAQRKQHRLLDILDEMTYHNGSVYLLWDGSWFYSRSSLGSSASILALGLSRMQSM